MIHESEDIVRRLNKLADRVEIIIKSEPNENQRRYLKSTEDLIKFNSVKLSSAISTGADRDIMLQLRSVSDMIKGVLDIGSKWIDDDPDGNRELFAIADDAHHLEKSDRTL